MKRKQLFRWILAGLAAVGLCVTAGFLFWNSPQGKNSETLVQKKKSQQKETLNSNLWQDVISGIQFEYPKGFKVERTDDRVVFRDFDSDMGEVFVFLHHDCQVKDVTGVYEAFRGYRERLLVPAGMTQTRTVIWDGPDQITMENFDGHEVLYETGPVLFLGKNSRERGRLKMGYRVVDGRAAAAGYLLTEGQEIASQKAEACVQTILKTMTRRVYKGKAQLTLPEDFNFKTRDFINRQLSIPESWRTIELGSRSVVYQPEPLLGDKLEGVKILGFLWSTGSKKMELGYEDRQFLKAYQRTIGAAVMQDPNLALAPCGQFYQENRQNRWINSRQWTLLEGFFSFEDPEACTLVPLPDHQAKICFTEESSGTLMVFVVMWTTPAVKTDVSVLTDYILETCV